MYSLEMGLRTITLWWCKWEYTQDHDDSIFVSVIGHSYVSVFDENFRKDLFDFCSLGFKMFQV